MRKDSMPAAAWCLAGFFAWELLAAGLIAYYLICPCCWPFPFTQGCRVTLNPGDLACRDPPCVRKCCPLGQALFYDQERHASVCKSTNSSGFSIEVVPLWTNDSSDPTKILNETEEYNRYSVIHIGLCPEGMFELDPEIEEDRNALLPDGYLFFAATNSVVTRDHYCLDNKHDQDRTRVFRCFPPVRLDGMSKIEEEVFPVMVAVSVPFLLITAAVYLLNPELQNLHGKSLLCHVSSLSVGYITLAPVQFNFLNMNGTENNFCKISAFVIQFSFLATFFWLNIMCFDIWWVFSGLRPLRGSVKEREHKKFIFYSLYAWGVPLIIFIISLVMELVPSIPDTFIKPRFGVDKCWFKDSDALVLYFYLPIGFLVLLNIVMFMTTAFRLHAHTRETKVLQSSESRRNDEAERQRFNLYLKLFIVMGINWVMEIVSFAIGGPKSIWFVTDIGNTLQGLLIFLIFVCKRRILRLLNQKLCPRWELVSGATTSVRSKVSPSRTNSTSLSKTVSSNPDGLALKPIARSASEDSDTNN